jgi:hypothetical protein
LTKEFYLLPTPQILQWLAAGQLGNRLVRSLRLWVLIDKLYSSQTNWANELPTPFTYSQLRDRLFAYRHPKSDKLQAQQITVQCGERNCICHRAFWEILFDQNCQQTESQWQDEIILLTGINQQELQKVLQEHPFATVHRSIRDDLKQLIQLGWLQSAEQRKYQCLAIEELPIPPIQATAAVNLPSNRLSHLTEKQSCES